MTLDNIRQRASARSVPVYWLRHRSYMINSWNLHNWPDSLTFVSVGCPRIPTCWKSRTWRKVGHFDGHKSDIGCSHDGTVRRTVRRTVPPCEQRITQPGRVAPDRGGTWTLVSRSWKWCAGVRAASVSRGVPKTRGRTSSDQLLIVRLHSELNADLVTGSRRRRLEDYCSGPSDCLRLRVTTSSC